LVTLFIPRCRSIATVSCGIFFLLFASAHSLSNNHNFYNLFQSIRRPFPFEAIVHHHYDSYCETILDRCGRLAVSQNQKGQCFHPGTAAQKDDSDVFQDDTQEQEPQAFVDPGNEGVRRALKKHASCSEARANNGSVDTEGRSRIIVQEFMDLGVL
jgi:hypothetical protein